MRRAGRGGVPAQSGGGRLDGGFRYGGDAGDEVSGAGIEGLAADAAAEVGTIRPDTRLQKLARGDYALNVHISEYDYGNAIACGDLTGGGEAGVLSFALDERDGSGFRGLARLTAEGKRTPLTVYVAPG